MTFVKLQYYIWIKRIREIRLMEFIDYRKNEVDDILDKGIRLAILWWPSS